MTNEKRAFCPKCFAMYGVDTGKSASAYRCLKCACKSLREAVTVTADELYGIVTGGAVPKRDEAVLKRHFEDTKNAALWEIHNPTEFDQKWVAEMGITFKEKSNAK